MMKSLLVFLSILLVGYKANSVELNKQIPSPPSQTLTHINELFDEMNYTGIVAHRALYNLYKQETPENSTQAVEEAIKLGIEFVEIDTRVTSDGVSIIMHDNSLERTTNGTGLVSERDFNYIKKFTFKK